MTKENQDVAEKIAGILLHENIHSIKKFESKKNYSIFEKKIDECIEKNRIRSTIGTEELSKKVYNLMFGYGILQELIDDESISDINITRFDHIVIKRRGKYQLTEYSFQNMAKFLLFCKLIVVRNGGKLNENHCFERVDDHEKRLRISASIPPRSAIGPTMSIRKHVQKAYTIDDLVMEKMLDSQSKQIIKDIIQKGKNIIICGKGAAGKTTLLRAILGEVPTERRFLICESENELYPTNRNFIVEKIISREYGKSVTLSELVRDGLSISLDGYCIGEIVGEEAWEFMQASFTDHTTYATIHANGVNEVKDRIKMLINQKVINYDESEIDRMILNSLDCIIYLNDFKVREIALCNQDKIHSIYRRTMSEHLS